MQICRFQEYLRIRSEQPNPDYLSCAKFLKNQGLEIGLNVESIELVAGKPIILLIWHGKVKQSVFFNSHMDVVPVSEEHWKFDPFAATINDGKIYARGSQDMKCVGMQYLEACRILKKTNFVPYFTLIFSFVPDEEIGGHDGMMMWVEKESFKAYNPVFAFDEGLASPTNCFKLYYGERAPFWIRIKSTGVSGHGSLLLENTSTAKLLQVLNRINEFRANQVDKQSKGAKIGDLTSANITMLSSGKQVNIIPECAEASVDIRVTPHMLFSEMEQLIAEWCNVEGVTMEYIQKFDNQNVTKIENNPFYDAVVQSCNDLNIKLETEIFPGATDSRYIRKAGIPAIGISPIRNTPVLLHAHDEYLTVDGYIQGIEFYVKLMKNLQKIDHELPDMIQLLKK
eukprot:NODE_537_length_7002_cov_0.281762.p1 type:complete len:397 gc:universal NODE_537_length_7002_cov_0.281762:5521-4331(-)